MHPNIAGHQLVADRFLDAVMLGPTPEPTHSVTVEVVSVKVSDPLAGSGDPTIPVLVLLDRGNGVPVDARSLSVAPIDETVVPSSVGKFAFELWREPTLPRLPTFGSLEIRGQLRPREFDDPEPPQGGPGGRTDPPKRTFKITVPMMRDDNYGATGGIVSRSVPVANGAIVEVRLEVAVRRLGPSVEDKPEPADDPLKKTLDPQ